MHPPTKKQRRLEHAVEELTVDGVPPSYEELGQVLGLSVGAVRSLVIGLCARGRARVLPRQGRTLELIKVRETA